MRIDINIEKSIESGRIRMAKYNGSQRLEMFFFFLISAVFTGCTLALLINGLAKPVDEAWIYLLSTSPFSLFGIICFFNLCLDNKLIRIKGIDQAYNSHRIQTLLERDFGKMPQGNSDKIMRLYKPSTCFAYGVRVIVLFDNADVLVNISRFNQKGVKSVFHSVFDYFRLRKIRQQFALAI